GQHDPGLVDDEAGAEGLLLLARGARRRHPELLPQHPAPGVLDREAADELGALDGDDRALHAVDQRRDRAGLDARAGGARRRRRLSARTAASVARYIEDGGQLVGGNAVRLLRNGSETFPAWLAAIESARIRISLEMYIFSDDAIGRQFADALIAAARRGVEVR